MPVPDIPWWCRLFCLLGLHDLSSDPWNPTVLRCGQCSHVRQIRRSPW